jgi:hypothetical protein
MNPQQLETLTENCWQLANLHLSETGHPEVTLILIARAGSVHNPDGGVIRYGGPTVEALRTMAKVAAELMQRIKLVTRRPEPEVQNGEKKS